MLEYFDKKGDKTMYSIADSWLDEGIAKGREQGVKEGMKEVAQKMISKNMPISQIIELTGLSKKEIELITKSSTKT